MDTLGQVTGYVFLAKESPSFIDGNLVNRLMQYANELKSHVFGAIVDFTELDNEVWTCPAGMAACFTGRARIGRVFVEHLCKSVFGNDLDNSVVELGDLLVHEGPTLS